MKPPVIILGLLALVLTPMARGDMIELTDGRKISGTMSRNGDVVTIKSDEGKVLQVKSAEIARVTLTSASAPDTAAAAWTRTRAQAQTAATLQAVIDLYQKFLDQFPAAAQASEARKALASYRAMLDQDPVKFRDTWIPRAQIAQATQRWAEAVRPALDLYAAGQIKSALDTVLPLTTEGQNLDALTLAGLASYRLKNYAAAKNYFTKLTAADPTSVAAENNLAVVCAAQKQIPETFVHYTKALKIMPSHRVLIDNVAEALHTYGNGDKTNPAYKALLAAYSPAETLMQEEMGKIKQYRWGASWVTHEQMDRLLKLQNEIRSLMAKLDIRYGTFQARLAQIQQQIKEADAQLDHATQIINACMTELRRAVQNQGVFYQETLDAAQKNRDSTQQYKSQLQEYYNGLIANTREFSARAEKLKAAVATGAPTGYFTGTPRLIDWAETDNPPAPAPVPETELPDVELPDVVLNPPAPPKPPVLVTVPTPPPVANPRGRGG